MGLTNEMRVIRQDIDRAHADRTSKLAQIRSESLAVRNEAKTLVSGFAKGRTEMGKVLRRDLEAYTSGIKKDVKTHLKNAKTARITNESKRKIEAKKMKADLASCVQKIGTEVQGIRKNARNLLSSFAGKRKEVATDIHGMHDAWTRKGHTQMHTKKGRNG